jgi:hypothetical protein
MAEIEVTVARAGQLAFSKHYIEETLALVAPGHRRGEFAMSGAIVEMSGARLAVRTERYYLERIADFMRGAELVPVDSFDVWIELRRADGTFGDVYGCPPAPSTAFERALASRALTPRGLRRWLPRGIPGTAGLLGDGLRA